jgi:hypothetical protein
LRGSGAFHGGTVLVPNGLALRWAYGSDLI